VDTIKPEQIIDGATIGAGLLASAKNALKDIQTQKAVMTMPVEELRKFLSARISQK